EAVAARVGHDDPREEPSPFPGAGMAPEDRRRLVTVAMNEPGSPRAEKACPERPPDEKDGTDGHPPSQPRGDGHGQDRDHWNQEPGRRIPAPAPHGPGRGRTENDGHERQKDGALPRIFPPDMEKTGKGEREHGGVDQEPELLVEQEAGETLVDDGQRELRSSAVDLPGVEKAIEDEVIEGDPDGRRDARSHEPGGRTDTGS